MEYVYVIKYWNSWFEGPATVKKIFSTREKAERYVSEQSISENIQEKYFIFEYEVN